MAIPKVARRSPKKRAVGTRPFGREYAIVSANDLQAKFAPYKYRRWQALRKAAQARADTPPPDAQAPTRSSACAD